MQGFKSFAHPTEMVFDRNLSVIVGPNGAGKCVVGNTLVQLADGSVVRIDDLVNNRLSKRAEKIDDGFVAEGDLTKILALNFKTLKIEPRPIRYYVKRKAPSKLIQIKTKSGRVIKTTKYHPLFAIRNGEIETLKAENLKEGVRIAVPRKLNIEPKTKCFTELLDIINAEDEIYVPWNQEFVDILFKIKQKKTWKELARKLAIPLNAIKGLIGKQAVNFTYLVKILRRINLSNEKIISLIPFVKARNWQKKYKVPWKNSLEFARFFGYLLAEGRLPPTSNQIWFTNGTEEVVEDYKRLIDWLFGVNSTVNEYKKDCWDVLAYSAPVRTILTKFGMPIGKTKDKKITNLFLAHSSSKELSELLNGLYCGDGYVSKKSIEITTKSEQLATAIESILPRLGIIAHSRFEIKIATNSNFSGVYKTIVISGVDNFRLFNQNILLVHKEKQKKVEALLGVKSNSNVDLIEVNPLIKQIIKELKINVKKNKKNFPRLDAYCYNQCTPSRVGVKHLLNNLFSKQALQASPSLVQLKWLCYSDIFWDEIIELKELKSDEEWVYDLCVEKDHNFVANNFIIHNSNIIDALCFVLGRLSMKSMRAAKSANLIYNGGKNKKAADEARVELVLDNSDKLFSVPGDVRIERIVRKDGFSIYKINKKTKTRQEVLELLAQANIDPLGFNIVLQGEISNFINMHPEEKRQVIEEIAGISIYETRKEKSIRELEKTEERLREVSAVLDERRAFLRNLDKERVQALRVEKLKNTVKRDNATLVYRRLKEKEQEVEKIKAQISEIESSFSKSKEYTNSVQEKIKHLHDEIEEINKHIEEATGVEQESLSREIAESKVEVAGLDVRLENYSDQLTKLNEREIQIQQDLKVMLDEIKSLTREKEKSKPLYEIDAESFKQKLFDLAALVKENSKQILDTILLLNEKIKECINELNAIDKTDKDAILEKLNNIYSLLSNNYQNCNKIADSFEENYKKLMKLAGMKIGKAYGRNIELELELKSREMDKMRLNLKRLPKERSELEKTITELRKQKEEREEVTCEKESKDKKIREDFKRSLKRRSILQDKERQYQEELMQKTSTQRKIEEDMNSFKIAKAKIEGELEGISHEFDQYKDLKADFGAIRETNTELEQRIKNNEEKLLSIGSVNWRALQVYENIKGEYEKIAEKANKLEQEKREILNVIEEIDRKKKRTFMKVFNDINSKFQSNFLKLDIEGRSVFLELENKENPFEGGIDIVIKIAKGKYLDASSSSGGERTNIGLSLIFAIQEYRPHHFYVLDEVDAALDKRNSERLSTLMREYIKNAQYIMISHNDPIISEAKALYGVSKQEGISKILSLKV